MLHSKLFCVHCEKFLNMFTLIPLGSLGLPKRMDFRKISKQTFSHILLSNIGCFFKMRWEEGVEVEVGMEVEAGTLWVSIMERC